MANQDLDQYAETTAPADDDLVGVRAASDGLWRKMKVKGYVTGKQTIWVPASAMTPTTTAGCAALTTVEYQSEQVDLNVLDYSGGANTSAVFNVAMPKGWDEGTVTFQLFWITTAADTDMVRFGLYGRALSDNESPAQTFTNVATADDNAQGAANRILISGESDALTIQGSPAEGDLCVFRLRRLGTSGIDTLSEDARVIGIKLFFTTNAPTDD